MVYERTVGDGIVAH